MDVVTGGLLGAAVSAGAAGKKDARAAAAIGFLAALLADADAFIRSEADPLLHLEYHRYFSHSLLFIPAGALIAAGAIWPVMRRRLPFGRIYAFAFLGYATAGLLDACTSYGTQLLWPFSDLRVAWDNIAIIDPVVTFCLAAGVIAAAIRRSPLPARIGFAIVVVYLLFGVVQRERAAEAQAELATGRGHVIERARVMPTIGNLVLWRSVYLENGSYHIDAVRVGIFAQERIYEGGSLPAFDADRDLPGDDRKSVLYRDVQRFRHFTQDYMAIQPGRPEVLGDVRYAILPNELQSLWGVTIDPTVPDSHVEFLHLGAARFDKWDAFWTMLRGDEMPGGDAINKENE